MAPRPACPVQPAVETPAEAVARETEATPTGLVALGRPRVALVTPLVVAVGLVARPALPVAVAPVA